MAMMDHEHEWVEFATFERAPIDDLDPIRHTSFRVLVCRVPQCTASAVFPEFNFGLATIAFRAMVRALVVMTGRDEPA